MYCILYLICYIQNVQLDKIIKWTFNNPEISVRDVWIYWFMWRVKQHDLSCEVYRALGTENIKIHTYHFWGPFLVFSICLAKWYININCCRYHQKRMSPSSTGHWKPPHPRMAIWIVIWMRPWACSVMTQHPPHSPTPLPQLNLVFPPCPST